MADLIHCGHTVDSGGEGSVKSPRRISGRKFFNRNGGKKKRGRERERRKGKKKKGNFQPQVNPGHQKEKK